MIPQASEKSLQRQAVKAILIMIKDHGAAMSIVNKDILPLFAKVACSNEMDARLKKAAIEAVMLLTPLL